MQYTHALKEFKKRFGNTNQFLITALVGLDGVGKGIVTKSDDFSTSWNPRDVRRAADRSRDFILKAFLNTASDSLESYLRALRVSGMLNDAELKHFQNKGLKEKVIDLGKELAVSPLLVALMDLLITLRNQTVHSKLEGKKDISPKSREVLEKFKKQLSDDYCGLVLHRKLIDISQYDVTFKEVASLISATHNYVYEVDREVILRTNFPEYYEAVFHKLYTNDSFKRKLLTGNERKNLKRLRTAFQNVGVSIEDEPLKNLLPLIKK